MIRAIGIDSVEVERIGKVYERYRGRFLDKLLSESEKSGLLAREDPVPQLASSFAAKEACMKALGTGWGRGVRWKDIEILRDDLGRPKVALSGEARKVFARLSANKIHCSLTHTKNVASAVVLFERSPP